MLSAQGFSQGAPSIVYAFSLQLKADGVYQMIGQNRNKQVAFDPVGRLVKHRTQAQFGLQRPKDRFQLGEHGVILIRYHTLKNAQNRWGWKAPPIAIGWTFLSRRFFYG